MAPKCIYSSKCICVFLKKGAEKETSEAIDLGSSVAKYRVVMPDAMELISTLALYSSSPTKSTAVGHDTAISGV